MNNTPGKNPTQLPQASAVLPQQGKPKKQKLGKKEKAKPKLTSFMMQWFGQYYKQLTIVICLLLFVIGYIAVLHPKLSSARTISSEEFNAALEKREQMEQQLAYLTKLESGRTIASLRTIKNIDYLLPSVPDTPQILTSLESIARASGVQIDGIELVLPEEDALEDLPDESRPPAGVTFVEVTLAVAVSPYEKLKTLLENIEKNIRLMDVIGIVYTPSGKSYTIILRAYYLQ